MAKITNILLAQQLAQVSSDLKDHRVEFKNHVLQFNTIINGQDNTPGLKGRIQSLEDHDQSTRWYFRAVWGAFNTALIGYFIRGH